MPVPWNDIAKGRGYETVGKMMRSMYPKFTIHQLAQRFGCSVDAVRRQLDKENIPIRARGGATAKPKLEKISAEDLKTKTAKELALEHGVDVTSIYKYMRRNGIEPPAAAKRRALYEQNEALSRVNEDVEGTLQDILKGE